MRPSGSRRDARSKSGAQGFTAGRQHAEGRQRDRYFAYRTPIARRRPCRRNERTGAARRRTAHGTLRRPPAHNIGMRSGGSPARRHLRVRVHGGNICCGLGHLPQRHATLRARTSGTFETGRSTCQGRRRAWQGTWRARRAARVGAWQSPQGASGRAPDKGCLSPQAPAHTRPRRATARAVGRDADLATRMRRARDPRRGAGLLTKHREDRGTALATRVRAGH